MIRNNVLDISVDDRDSYRPRINVNAFIESQLICKKPKKFEVSLRKSVQMQHSTHLRPFTT